MPSYFHFERFHNLSSPAKVAIIAILAILAVIAWPVMVAAIFALIVLSTLQDKRIGYAMTIAMVVPALLMEGFWASSLIAGTLNSRQAETPNDGSQTNVAVVDHQNQVRGSQDKKETPKVKVLQAVSGDTLDVDIDGSPYRIRLVGVDAPNLDDTGTSECFAAESQIFLHSLLKDRSVEVVKDAELGEKDANGNLWRYIRMTDGTKVNELMLEAGLAREDSAETYEQQDIYVELADAAKQNNKGLWATCGEDGQPKVTPVPTTESDVSGGDKPDDGYVQPTAIPTVVPDGQ